MDFTSGGPSIFLDEGFGEDKFTITINGRNRNSTELDIYEEQPEETSGESQITILNCNIGDEFLKQIRPGAHTIIFRGCSFPNLNTKLMRVVLNTVKRAEFYDVGGIELFQSILRCIYGSNGIRHLKMSIQSHEGIQNIEQEYVEQVISHSNLSTMFIHKLNGKDIIYPRDTIESTQIQRYLTIPLGERIRPGGEDTYTQIPTESASKRINLSPA